MSHNLITLNHDRFYSRVALYTPLLNVHGETHEVEIEVAREGHNVFKAYKKGTKDLLCEFCAWHMHGGPDMYQIEHGGGRTMADATLIVMPSLESWTKEFGDPDKEEE